MKFNIIFIFLIMVPGYVLSQNTTQNPCESDPHYKDFDFWLGAWDVFDKNGKKAGTNIIVKEEKGCLIIERWTGVSGSTGQSYNYYNPDSKKWTQIWVSPSVIIEYTGGLTKEGAMELRGEIVYRGNKKRAQFLGRWTPQKDGTVLQYFEQYDADKKKWIEWFTGIYKRQK